MIQVMSNKERFYAAACQMDMPNPVSRDEIELRVTKMLEMIDYAVIGYKPFHDVKLVVFPEFAHAAPIYDTAEKLIDRLAIPVPNEFTDRYHKKARDLVVRFVSEFFSELVMMFVIRKKRVAPRFYCGMVPTIWIKQHKERPNF